MERCQNITLKTPKTLPKKQRRVFQAPDLKGILQAFTELRDVQRYLVDVKLTPSNDSNTFISPYQRQKASSRMPVDSYWNGSDYDYDIRGSPVITSGKHYWEVDVSNKRTWILGVCYKRRKQDINYQPKHGYWVIGLQNRGEYVAFEDSSSSNPVVLTLFLTFPPRVVGVFIDYDAGTVSFFNLPNGFLIYEFSVCDFPQRVYPYFNPRNY
ncbi:PREDICTED: tripartite motif-containing protein 5-like [Galeopterus variegatus]|uniref:Tripartite motif-containing protein 5-like n=1 Tax=Galeopterus variegatus TaxID=482537 RepID=A0ABM0Q360_GALVR|nr:PREDICTED: tripartite motif-containing protein 5-like [Galeopterus variegatus]